MGTSARDDIDIGIVVREIAGSTQVVDRIKAKLGELRAEAAKPLANAGIAAAAEHYRQIASAAMEAVAAQKLEARAAAEAAGQTLKPLRDRDLMTSQLAAARKAINAEFAKGVIVDPEASVAGLQTVLTELVETGKAAKACGTEIGRLNTLNEQVGATARTAAAAIDTETKQATALAAAVKAVATVPVATTIAAPAVTPATNKITSEIDALEEGLALELDLIHEAGAKRIMSREAVEQKETELVATFARNRAEIRLRLETPAPGEATTFEAEHKALRARFNLDQEIINEGVAKRVQTERQGHDEIMRLIEQFSADELALRERFGAATVRAVATAGPVQLGPQLPASMQAGGGIAASTAAATTAATQSAQQLSTEINVAIGAYQRMARQIDLTDKVAVAAFRAEGEALSAYLFKLGATDQELNVIANTIAKVERRSGGVQLVPPIGAATIASYDRMNPKIRTAANAMSLLSVAAVTGGGSLQGMSLAAGNVAQGIAVMTTSVRIAAAATGIGALVTIIATVVALTAHWREENEKTKASLDELNAKLIEGGETRALRATLDRVEAQVDAARRERDRLAAERRQQVRGTGIVTIGAEDVAAAEQRLQGLEQQQNRITTALVKRAQEAAKEVDGTQQKLAEDAVRASVARTRGEFAARRIALEQEFAAERKRIEESGADEAKIDAAVVALRRKRTQDFITLDTEENTKLAELRRQAAGQLLTIQTEQLQGEIAAQRKAIEIELADKVNAINREVGLESVRAIRIAAARADAVNKIAKIDREQAAKSRDLSLEFTRATAEAAAAIASPLARATADADRQRAEDQKRINQIDLGDAEATATEKFNLEVEADERRNATIEKARREHGEELKRISDETENGILELTGRASEARRNVINAEFDERIRRAKELGASTPAISAINVERGLQLAKVDLDELVTTGTRALEELDNKLSETQALATTGAISERQARDTTTAAYQRARASIKAVIDELLRLAALAGNDEATKAAEELKKKYDELGITLAKLDDPLKRLKSGALDALQNGLGQGIDETIEGAKNLRDIWATTALSIVNSIRRIIAEMLAQLVVQRLLRLFNAGSSASTGAQLLQFGVDTLPGVAAASGGQVRGPKGRDVIPAWLTDEEYIISAPRVRQFGRQFFDLINFAGRLPPIILPGRIRGFETGGLVRAGGGSTEHTWRGSSDVRLSLDRGIIAEVMRSSEGQEIQLETLRRNGHHVRSLFGRGG